MRTLAVFLTILALPASAHAESFAMPPEIALATEEAFAECRDAGGTPSLDAHYIRAADLNADGQPDYLVDLAGLICENAWSYFCGSGGCPVAVWLSSNGDYSRGWTGYAQESAIDGATVVVSLHGQFCDPPRQGSDGCEERLAFATDTEPMGGTAEPSGGEGTASELPQTTEVPAPPIMDREVEPDIEAAAPAAGPQPQPRPDELAPPARSRPEPGWTVRDVPGDRPLALAGGPGQVFSVSAFCLGGRPWLALDLDPPPSAPAIRADFGFSASRVEAEALREEGAGGAFVIELEGGPLAGLLAGADTSAALGIDGTQQGRLSLSGSSRAIRVALADCHSF